MELLLKNQTYLVYLMSVMIVSGIIKDHRIFVEFYEFLHSKVRSKRLLLILISGLSGILPVPGRVTLSAGILSTLISNKKESRSKFGLIDYLSTHHYYLWSPLEKTVIIPMAVLGLSYSELLGYTFPLLVISIGYIAWYIFSKIKEEDLNLPPQSNRPFQLKSFLQRVFPLLFSIAGLIAGGSPLLVFLPLVGYYILFTAAWRDVPKIFSYINVKLVIFLAFVIAFGNYLARYEEPIRSYLHHLNLDLTTTTGLLTISIFAFGSSFLLGSSSKFAGIMTLLTTIYGIEYFTFFLALEFSGYLVSPFHKCLTIGKMYFDTPIRSYLSTLSFWCILMISYATLPILLKSFFHLGIS